MKTAAALVWLTGAITAGIVAFLDVPNLSAGGVAGMFAMIGVVILIAGRNATNS